MTYQYEKVATPSNGLRLHLNENTSGCAPAVIDALRSITCEQAAFYPDYSAAVSACARFLHVDEQQVALTNGLDEGILVASVAALRGSAEDAPFEAIIIVPAFDMYAAYADAAGGRVVEIPLGDDFEFPLERVLNAINRRTRIVYVTNPNNPSGLGVPRAAILAIADAAPQALILLDEAYADFSGTTLIVDAALATRPNVLIGRTFSKAHGLAALRVGAIVGTGEILSRVRRVIPPYSLNVAAAVALPAALADRRHYEDYLRQVDESKRLLYVAFDRLQVKYWRSEANFVLARFGDRASRVVGELRKRDVHVRDRSGDTGCEGCVRITAGVVDHTRQCIDAIEDVLCGAL
jgi:histidinol-phosphate aminotransferase